MIYLNFTYTFKIMLLLEIKFYKSSNNNKKFVSWKDYSLASPKSQQKKYIYIKRHEMDGIKGWMDHLVDKELVGWSHSKSYGQELHV